MSAPDARAPRDVAAAAADRDDSMEEKKAYGQHRHLAAVTAAASRAVPMNSELGKHVRDSTASTAAGAAARPAKRQKAEATAAAGAADDDDDDSKGAAVAAAGSSSSAAS